MNIFESEFAPSTWIANIMRLWLMCPIPHHTIPAVQVWAARRAQLLILWEVRLCFSSSVYRKTAFNKWIFKREFSPFPDSPYRNGLWSWKSPPHTLGTKTSGTEHMGLSNIELRTYRAVNRIKPVVAAARYCRGTFFLLYSLFVCF